MGVPQESAGDPSTQNTPAVSTEIPLVPQLEATPPFPSSCVAHLNPRSGAIIALWHIGPLRAVFLPSKGPVALRRAQGQWLPSEAGIVGPAVKDSSPLPPAEGGNETCGTRERALGESA